MATGPLARALPALVAILVLAAAAVAAQGVARLDTYQGVAVRILQSNNAGNIHHIIDPDDAAAWSGVIKGCPHAHNLTVAPGRALLLLRERAGQDRRRVRQQDAAAGAADRAVGAAQQDRRQQEAQEDLRRRSATAPMASRWST